jgi:hypothetical protein
MRHSAGRVNTQSVPRGDLEVSVSGEHHRVFPKGDRGDTTASRDLRQPLNDVARCRRMSEPPEGTTS